MATLSAVVTETSSEATALSIGMDGGEDNDTLRNESAGAIELQARGEADALSVGAALSLGYTAANARST